MRALPAIIFIALLAAAHPGADLCAATGPEAVLRKDLAAALENGTAHAFPPGHPLRPIIEAPSIATLAYLLFENDTPTLARLYPYVSRAVTGLFAAQNLTADGFITGERLGSGDIAYPGLNALAALELHSLSLIAAAAGAFEDAIELRDWSHRFSEAVRSWFYDHASGTFRPLGGGGSPKSACVFDQLLPFLAGRGSGQWAPRRTAERIRAELNSARSEMNEAALCADPALDAMARALLSGSEARELYSEVLRSAAFSAQRDTTSRDAWAAFWNNSTAALRRMLPAEHDLFILRQLAAMLEHHDLLVRERGDPFNADIAALAAYLERETIDLDMHIEALRISDRLSENLSAMTAALETKERLWKIFDERRWNRLSPREGRIAREACRLADLDLEAAAGALSARMLRATGITAALNPPLEPVRGAEEFTLEASLAGERAVTLVIERVSLRASGNSWMRCGEAETLSVDRGAGPWSWKRSVSLPPPGAPGLVKIDAVLDVTINGKRAGIRLVESFSHAPKHELALHFPRGRALAIDPTPLEIVLRHPPGERRHGTLSGFFAGDLSCEPRLPADFVMYEGTDLTILPLSVSTGAETVPGRHSFFLRVSSGATVIAEFEESFVIPLRWLHLGPLPNERLGATHAVTFAEDLNTVHTLPLGDGVRWRAVPPAAFDESGSVLPALIYGALPDRCMLLYAAVETSRPRTVKWRLGGGCRATLWINHAPLTGAAAGAGTWVSELQSGRNSIVLCAAWDEPGAGILLEILDESGLPVEGLRDVTGEVFRAQARSTSPPAEPLQPATSAAQPREVAFVLAHPEAREVSLIGEFNGWSPQAAPMRLVGAGIWKTSVYLPPGRYSYKFLVDRRHRIVDPDAETTEPDGFGGLNAVITVK